MTDKDSAAYDAVEAQQKALGHQLFELLVWDNWYGSLGVALRGYEFADSGREYTYRSEPNYSPDEHGHHNYVGGSTLEQARRYKAKALGEEIDDDRLKELVEEVLHDELEKYNIELRWMYRTSWDGQDRILCIYPRS